MSFLRVVLCVVFMSGGLLAVSAADTKIHTPFSKGPYIQFPAPGGVSVMWECSTNLSGIVRWGQNGRLDRDTRPVLPRRMRGNSSSGSGTNKVTVTNIFYLYKVQLIGVEPGADYSYSVELGSARTAPVSFKALDPDAEATRFVVYGDSRSDPIKHRAVASRFLEHRPDFILHTGDLVASGENYSLWSREFFEPLADVIDRIPFFSVIGNHEQNGANYLNYFDLPGKELWYSLDVGPVHVLALDFRSEKSSQEQFKFARRDLMATQAPWKIVIVHVPVYNLGGHGSTWGHAAYLPLFYMAKVDLVIAGHSHLYERFRPLKASPEEEWAITPITTGGGGANLYPSIAHPGLVAFETTNHFMVFEAEREQLRGKAIRVDGSLIDSFSISKPVGGIPEAYFSEAFPRKTLDRFFELAPGLTGWAATLPETNKPARVLLRILPLKQALFFEEMEISLSTESASNYQVVGAPVRALTPAPGQTNLVWVDVLARAGVTPSGSKDKEISPPLLFRARDTAPGSQTVSSGGASMLSSKAGKLAAASRTQ